MSRTVLQPEIEKFAKDAAHWWDETGPFKPLHRMNPVRMGYIRRALCGHFGLSQTSLKPFDFTDHPLPGPLPEGRGRRLKILDIGCGGGLACEPMARLGADVTGIDADAVAIDVAKEHAKISGLKIDYQCSAAEDLLYPSQVPSPSQVSSPSPQPSPKGEGVFDAVLALEIIEHVVDPAEFVATCAKLLKPGGMVIFSTLNRTPKAFALGIVAAEYVLGLVPRGTHDWKKFVKPSELARYGRGAGLLEAGMTGIVLKPLSGDFMLSGTDPGVNYMMAFKK